MKKKKKRKNEKKKKRMCDRVTTPSQKTKPGQVASVVVLRYAPRATHPRYASCPLEGSKKLTATGVHCDQRLREARSAVEVYKLGS